MTRSISGQLAVPSHAEPHAIASLLDMGTVLFFACISEIMDVLVRGLLCRTIQQRLHIVAWPGRQGNIGCREDSVSLKISVTRPFGLLASDELISAASCQLHGHCLAYKRWYEGRGCTGTRLLPLLAASSEFHGCRSLCRVFVASLILVTCHQMAFKGEGGVQGS